MSLKLIRNTKPTGSENTEKDLIFLKGIYLQLVRVLVENQMAFNQQTEANPPMIGHN